MPPGEPSERLLLDADPRRLLELLLAENPRLAGILSHASAPAEVRAAVRGWARELLTGRPEVLAFQRGDREAATLEALTPRDRAAVRLLDYADHEGLAIPDPGDGGRPVVSAPFSTLWRAVRGGEGAGRFFLADMVHLFRQLRGAGDRPPPDGEEVRRWMERWPSGLDPRIAELRRANRERIIRVLVDRMEAGELHHAGWRFEPGLTRRQKRARMRGWWRDHRFHLAFAVRSPALLHELLDRSLTAETQEVLEEARRAGMPFFVNPYYLSLLHVRPPPFARGTDLAIRSYVFYSRALVRAFGRIVAWEREDEVRPGEPNAAGWLLPSEHNVHRRYPDVAILIPDTAGRACGGLCSVCQRMYEFQRGNLTFELESLRPRESWPEKLERLLAYWEEDAQLRDILVTGGDALMSTDASLARILDGICRMAARKRAANRGRADGAKFAEVQRVRLGTRLPVYLPQRITPALTELLRSYGERAREAGISQLVVQTHFESPLELTPESLEAIRRLRSAGWTVTNQHVLTVAASRRGHAARLRQVLEEAGVLPYYTFSVKGFCENREAFTPHARAVQELWEEKAHGRVPAELMPALCALTRAPEHLAEGLAVLVAAAGLPFLATDRTVLNLPGVGKSLTFRVVGITPDGRRVLEFDHDRTRPHSPIVERLGKVRVVESKPVGEYLEQLEAMGEDPADYEGLFGYSLGETEPRLPPYEYPDPGFRITPALTNLRLEPAGSGPVRPPADGCADAPTPDGPPRRPGG